MTSQTELFSNVSQSNEEVTRTNIFLKDHSGVSKWFAAQNDSNNFLEDHYELIFQNKT